MSRINTRILQVPATTSGQIDARAIGSFSAPMEAAGNALAGMGDLGKQIALKEQALDDDLISGEILSEAAMATQRAEAGIAQAKSIEEIEGIQRALDEDFKSLSSRVDQVGSDEMKQSLNRNLTVSGGMAAIKTQTALGAIKTAMSQADDQKIAEQAAREGLQTGDMESSVAKVRAIVESKMGTTYPEWEDPDKIVRSYMNDGVYSSWKLRVDEGKATKEAVLSDTILTPRQQEELISDIESTQLRKKNESEREAAIANQKFRAEMETAAFVNGKEPSPLESMASVKSRIEEQFKDDPAMAQAEWYAYVQRMLSSYSRSISINGDGGPYVDEEIGKLDEAIAAESDQAVRDFLKEARQELENDIKQKASISEADQEKLFQQNFESVVERILSVDNAGGKINGKLLTPDQYEQFLMKEAGILNKTKTEAYSSKPGMTGLNYEKTIDAIKRAKFDFIQKHYKSNAQDQINRARAGSVKDLYALEGRAFSMARGPEDMEAFASYLRGEEVDPDQAEMFSGIVDAMAMTGQVGPYVQKFFLGAEDLQESAELWMGPNGKGIPNFNTENMSAYEKRRAFAFMNYVARRRGNETKEQAAESFVGMARTSDEELQEIERQIGKENLDLFIQNTRQYRWRLLSGEEKSTMDFDKGAEFAIQTDLVGELKRRNHPDPESRAKELIMEQMDNQIEMIAAGIATREGLLQGFLQEDPGDINSEIMKSVFSRAVETAMFHEGETWLSPSRPGQKSVQPYSPERAFNVQHPYSGGFTGWLTNSQPKRAFRRASSYTPMMATLSDAMAEQLGDILNDDARWLKEIESKNPDAKHLRKVLQDAQGVKRLSGEKGTAAEFINSNLDKISSDNKEWFLKQSWREMDLQTTNQSIWDKPVFQDPRALDRLLKSNVLSVTKGERLNDEELRELNRRRARLAAAGYNTPPIHEAYKTRFTINDSQGNAIYSVETYVLPEYGLYDVIATEESLGQLRAEGKSIYESEEAKSPTSQSAIVDLFLTGNQ